jgi:hypothetical protein
VDQLEVLVQIRLVVLEAAVLLITVSEVVLMEVQVVLEAVLELQGLLDQVRHLAM